jgi:hypothetical protein
MKPEGATRLRVIPITLPSANAYIGRWHRHHAPLETIHGGTTRTNKGFAWFCLAAISDENIVGVAVIGRPSNRNSDDGQTLEVLRLATDDTPNACSFLLGCCSRTANTMGAARIITYTLESETGTSLRAAGWNRDADGIQSCWTKGKGKARKGGSGNTIWREHMNVGKVRWSKEFRDPANVTIVEREQLAGQEALFA